MRPLALLIVLMLVGIMPSLAQVKCGFGGDENFKRTERILTLARSCSEAARDLNECAWGSSADSAFASIVIPKCEQEFRRTLTAAADRRYLQETKMCGYEYSKQSGTMSISAAALCEVNIAEGYATKSALRLDPPLRASFDCALSESDVEKAICSDEQLGLADIVLSRVYTSALRQPGFQFSETLRNDQRNWLRDLPTQCQSSRSSQPGYSKCLRAKIESRFSLIDICGEGALNENSWTASRYLTCLRDSKSLMTQ